MWPTFITCLVHEINRCWVIRGLADDTMWCESSLQPLCHLNVSTTLVKALPKVCEAAQQSSLFIISVFIQRLTALIWQLLIRVSLKEPFIYLASSYEFSDADEREPFSCITHLSVLFCACVTVDGYFRRELGSICERWLSRRQKDGIIGSGEIGLSVRKVSGHSTWCHVVKALALRRVALPTITARSTDLKP